MSKISNQELKQLFHSLDSNIKGLSDAQVEINRNKHGSNILEKGKRQTFFKKFLLQFKNVMVIVLLVSALVSLGFAIAHKNTSDLFEGFLILGIVIVNAIVGALQERKAENTLALLESKTRAQAKVVRNGKLTSVDFDDVVVGDIVELKIGDIIPADIRLFETNDFCCDESSLTGESKKTQKEASATTSPKALLSDRKNMCFKGTTVARGNAKGIVVATGKSTEFGKIAGLISNSKKQKTPLEQNIDKIGKLITIGVSIIVVIVFAVQLIFSNNVNIGDAFMTAIALAVAAIPESLPAVITIIMALGVQKLAKHNAIVKTLSSVETLGCCDCICTDKTGTLTQNQMKVVSIFTSNKLFEQNEFSAPPLENVLKISSLCSNATINDQHQIAGDATEKALLNLCLECKFDILAERKNSIRVKEFPFDSVTKRMITINLQNNKHTAYIKGAYDYLISKCSHIKIGDEVILLTKQHKQQIQHIHDKLTQNAQRVLMMAEKSLSNPTDFDESNLVFVAIIGMFDPPRNEVFSAIQQCHRAGMKPIMITGDHKDTAFAIAKTLKIAKNISEVITGNELDHLSQKDLTKIIGKYSVFARVTPEHKSKIVRALKQNGNVVAMTGDGVNDAPSIKESNIGTCMGSGTDVTKSVADLIITDDNFATIVLAVSEGRTIFNNIQKTIQFLISTNAVEVLGLFVASIIMRDSIFLTASQILFINLITDSLPAFALGIEPPEKDIMNKPPRDSKSGIFSGDIGTAIIYQAFIQTFVVLILFVWSYHKLGPETSNTMTFLTICLMQILHAVNCKSSQSLFKINIFKNKFFNLSFLALLGLILIVGLVPSIGSAFSLVPLSPACWIIVIVASLSIIPLVEIGKMILNKKQKSTL